MANPFYFRNGKEAKDLDEFYTVLRQVKAKEFEFHVGDNKNDFADWIEHLGKKTLAKKVRKQENITQLRNLLKKELKSWDEKPKKKKTKKKKKSSKTSKKTTKATKKAKKKTKPRKQKPKAKEHSRSKTFEPESLEETSQNLERQYQISTEAPHVFILKEFLFGALFGLVLGLILTAIIIQSGVVM